MMNYYILLLKMFVEQAWVKNVEGYETFLTQVKSNFTITWEFHIQ